MAEVLKKYGRYFLLDHIAQGGMAEIFRARLATVDGAGRLIVIKRIQSGFGSNVEFIKMFRAEIKVTMGLNHPNIVQVYDFGEEQGQPFIAMEFVDGRTVRQILARTAELKTKIPVDLAVSVIMQSATGMHYAHSFRDKITGQPLNIVHRDISPQNILIAYEGAVKVIDFGIARAATTGADLTRAGVIKGKPSYLSPEQINSEPIDGRCDVFGLGIVLWELLSGRKLFAGENDMAVLRLIENCNTHVKPPSTLNPDVPKELDYIVLKSLAKQREKRYQNAEEFQRALHKFMFARNPDFDPSELSNYVKNLFKQEIIEDRKHIQKLNDKAQKLLEADVPVTSSNTGEIYFNKTRHDDTTTVVQQRNKASSLRNIDDGGDEQGRKQKVEIDAPQISKGLELTNSSDHSSFGIILDSKSDVSIPIAKESPKKDGNTRSRSIAAPLQNLPQTQNTGGASSRSWLRIALIAAGLCATSLYLYPDVLDNVLNMVGHPTVQKTAAPAVAVAPLTPSATISRSGKYFPLRLNVQPWPWTKNARVTVNDKLLDITNPVISVELDSTVLLVAELSGFNKLIREFTVASHEAKGLQEYAMDVQLEPFQYGTLTLRTTPSADSIMINGEDWHKRTPIQNEKLPVGTYTIKATNDVLQMEKIFAITIPENKSITIDEKLQLKDEKTGRVPSGEH